MMKKLSILLTLSGLLFFGDRLAASDQLVPGFGGNRAVPIKIVSEELAIDQKANQALFSGNARATQGGMSITALRMSIHYQRIATSETSGRKLTPTFLYASGDVVLRGEKKGNKPPPVATARLAEYNIKTRKLILVGDVVLEQDGQVLKGQSLNVDIASGLTRLDSAQVGQLKRIRGVLRKK